jgi:hypothetical protein
MKARIVLRSESWRIERKWLLVWLPLSDGQNSWPRADEFVSAEQARAMLQLFGDVEVS